MYAILMLWRDAKGWGSMSNGGLGDTANVVEAGIIKINRERDLRRLARLRTIDDDFMRCVFRDQPQLTQCVLSILTGISDLEVVDYETQKDLKRLVGARSVELDVWAVDGAGRWYDIEVQRSDRPRPRRARYHSAAMDVEALSSSQEFEKLPEQWVIFLMEEDPFGEGKGLYRFSRVENDGQRQLEDGTHILYANGAYRGSDELGGLMADFSEPDPDRIQNKLLAERVRYFKETEEGVGEMCEVFEEVRREALEQGIERGIEQGIEQERLSNVRSLMANLQMSVQDVLAALGVPASEWPTYLAMIQSEDLGA